MSPQAIIALTTALLGLAACTDKEIDTALAAIKGDQARLDQLNQDQDGRIAALYAQVSSQAQESTSSSSRIAASQVATVQEPSSSVVPEPSSSQPTEPCVPRFRVLSCGPNGEYLWW